MQYIKELPNGNRVSVTQSDYNIDRYRNGFVPIISKGDLRIYSTHGKGTINPPRPLKYAGRGRGGPGNVWGGA